MDKKTQFITAVQTGLIMKEMTRIANESGTGAWMALSLLDHAFKASERIPNNKTAIEAATEFLEFMFADTPEHKGQWFLDFSLPEYASNIDVKYPT